MGSMRIAEPSGTSIDEIGLFLDVDGTLLDIAPRPEAVEVSSGLVQDLAAVERRLDGALALISGRPIAELDQLFAPLRLRASGVHGAEIRFSPDAPVDLLTQDRLGSSFWDELNHLIGEFPESYAENKGVSFAVHYPVPGTDIGRLQRQLSRLMRRMDPAGETLRILAGHAVFEIQLRGFDKGRAIERFIEKTPFFGRKPVFIADDVIDRAGFEAAMALGGRAYSVGIELPGLDGRFAGPSEVRAWLHEFAR
jgi:trehalose 6-phosphate phosphatase